MNLSKCVAGLMAAVTLAAFACERPRSVSDKNKVRKERIERVAPVRHKAQDRERETQKAFYEPMKPPEPDVGPSPDTVSPTEAAGLAVGKKALEELETPEVKGAKPAE